MRIEERAKEIAFVVLFGVAATISFSNSLFEITSSVFMALALFSAIGFRRLDLLKTKWGAFLGLYLFLCAASFARSQYPFESWKGLFRVFRCILLSLSVVQVVDSEIKFRRIYHMLLAVAVFICYDALIQGFTGTELLRDRSLTAYSLRTGRITGPFGHANDFAAYLSFVVFLFIGALQTPWKRMSKRLLAFYAVGLALVLSCLVWTYSRGAWIAVLLTAVLVAALTRKKRVLAAFFLLLVTVFLFASPDLKGRIASLGTARDSTTHERKLLWEESFRMIQDSPWTGLGINTYARNEPRYKLPESQTDFQYAHNGYLQIAAETGFLGLFGFLTVFIYFFSATATEFLVRRSLFAGAAGLGLTAGVFAFLLHSATDTGLQSLLLVNTLWLGMGLAWAARTQCRLLPK
jgi:putative inorganic carbon (HCO3(-)) transporter